MNYKLSKNVYVSAKHKGIVLLFTLVLLVVFATLAYTLTTKVRAQRSRDQYMVDYQAARYACDSAIKYADTALNGLKFKLISRPNEPDFSDLFSLTDEEYQQLIDIWEMDLDYTDVNNSNDYDVYDNNDYESKPLDLNSMMSMPGFGDGNDMNDPNYQNQFGDGNDFGDLFGGGFDSNEPNEITIRGPYGPEWPYATKPVEIEIGTAKVTIEIIDENSKYPIGWALIEDDDIRNEAIAGFEGFCEWMDVNSFEIEQLLLGLDEIREIKEFQVEFKSTKEASKPKDPNDTKETKAASKKTRKRRITRRNAKKTKAPRKKEIPISTHITDFARLFNSPLIDVSILSRATQISDDRHESALKYTSLWPAGKVNINTAPRHVLEAAFVFGGDSVEIADEIIVARCEKPFVDIDGLKKALFEYSNSIAKCEEFITTESDFFTVRITAVSGVAKVTSVVAVKRTGRRRRFEVIAAISGW
ncbi:MAG: general secretion pathway protein GspK [Planctomycetes bacterium]|nr:general secretion pathway protein GspK [Planctomycetota bacterium]